MAYPKGFPKVGGRKKGTRNKRTVEVETWARGLLEDPAYVASLRQRLIDGKAPHMETLLSHYAYGKPVERHEHSGAGGLPLMVQLVNYAADEAPGEQKSPEKSGS